MAIDINCNVRISYLVTQKKVLIYRQYTLNSGVIFPSDKAHQVSNLFSNGSGSVFLIFLGIF